MSDKPIHLTAAVYADRDRANVLLQTLELMHKGNTISLVDAALISKGEDGKISVEETAELTTKKGAKRGAIALGVVGLIFPPSLIASVVVGGGIGALAGKLRDTGIKKDDLQEFADSIQPGQAAVLALSDPMYAKQIESALTGYDGKLLTHEIGGETAEDLNSHFAEGDIDEESETPPTG